MRYASVCDGIGAVHVAWKPLGWECAWTSEIEPFPAAVVDHHWKLKNLGDMTTLTEDMLHDCGPISLLCGGTPCQSFSVAGLRKGLEDPRGNLALRFTQLVGVLRPEWVVWENVPGVLSSGNGRDFGTFLGALAELGYGFAYRVLDAQWFGVAQRRRRVFVVANARDWRRAAAVLFERESLFGNPPTRGEERQRTAACAAEGSGVSVDFQNSSLSGGTTGTLDSLGQAKGNRGVGVLACFHPTQDPISSEDCLVHAIGTGSSGGCATAAVAFDTTQITSKQNYSRPKAGEPCHPLSSTAHPPAIAFASRTRDGIKVPEVMVDGVTPALTNPGDGGRSDAVNVVVPQAVAFDTYNQSTSDVTQTLRDSHGTFGDACPAVAIARGHVDTAGTLRSNFRNNSDPRTESAMHVMHGMCVRRLTPCECERLQGFPDGYTDVTYRNKPAADGPRYKALGNSMAVPVMAWLGARIAQVDGISTEATT